MRLTPTTLLALALATAAAACGSDGTAPLGPDAASDALADTSAPGPGLGIDYESTSGGVAARWDPASSDWTATPWPSDRFRRADGTLDLSRFPNPGDSTLITHYVAYGEVAVDGFSRNGAVYFQLSGPLDMGSLPSDAASREPRSLAQLVDVTTPGAPGYGARLPLVFHDADATGDPYYMGPTLALRAVYGFPLADGGRYCAFLTRGLEDAAGRYLERAPAFVEALESDPALAPLRELLASGETAVAAVDLAAATCFTTQDATRDMRRIQAFLEARATGAVTELAYNGATAHFHELVGRYLTPNFQEGVKPYTDEGGDVRFDAQGEPIVQEEEAVRVRILIPKNLPMPSAGWPVVLYGHGTGGNWQSCLDATDGDPMRDGLAMLCIDQPLHGIRGVGDDSNFLNSFNFMNPAAGRMSFRQSAADVIWLAKMVADGRFDIPGGATTFGKSIRMDPDKIMFFGHSHGGLAGVIVLGVDTRLKGAVLSGASGVMAETIVRRKDIVDIQALVATIIDIDTARLDTFHPVVNLTQTLVDATDPINYAPYWLERVTGGRAKHVFMTEGTLDEASPAVGADAVAAAAGIPLVEEVVNPSRAHALKGIAAVTMPVSLDVATSTGELVTAGLKQFEGGDHFVAFTDANARLIWRGFLRALRSGETPVITP